MTAINPKLVTTAFELPGCRIVRNIGVVRGIVVRSRSIVGTIGASLQTLVGGNITLFTQLCERARDDAFRLMLEHAAEHGANALVGVRYDANEVAAAVRTGVAGVSIEDSTGSAANALYDRVLAVERVRAARRAIDDSGTGVLLTGRSEGFIAGHPDLAETIARLVAYAEAGADCLYAPGVRSMNDVSAIVHAVAPKPVNVLVSTDFTSVAQLAELGVRRISVCGALARAAWTGFLNAAREIATTGTFSALARNIPVPDMNELFGPARRHDQS